MMDVQKIEVSMEDFKCRIPALFPYLEWNSDGTTETHAATDSENGCYGKVVDNMKIPKDVRLTNYVQIQEEEVRLPYEWKSSNTIGLSENSETYFATSAAPYLRKVLLYQYLKIDEEIEDAVLLESLPSSINDESPEYVKTLKIGLDGTIVGCENVVLYDYYKKTGVYYYYTRMDIIKPCETYSYRTIINEYYKYRNIVGRENTFVKFVEDGIGCITVDRHLLNIEDTEIYDEVPDFIYLSQVKKLKDQYEELKKAYIHYNTFYLANGKTSVSLKERCEKYTKMGGDNFNNWLSQMLQKAYDLANYYKCRAENKDYPVRFTSNVMLTKRTQILGLEEVYDNTFVPGNRYYDGDLLTYNGKTYVCQIDRIVQNGDNYEYIRKTINNDGFYVKALLQLDISQNNYMIIENPNITYISSSVWDKSTLSTEFVVVDSQYYRWNFEDNIYEPIDVREYSTGVWDEQTERYVFDSQHFVPLSELTNYDEWYDDVNPYGEKFKFFVDLDYIPSNKIYDYIRYNESIFKWDENTGEYVPFDGEENTIILTTNSKLKELRTHRGYINAFGEAEVPNENEDWLYYYKIGNINGKMIETDEIGNIVCDGTDFVIGQRCYDLHAYGNIITSIEYDNTSDTLTFTYVIGAHLTAIADDIYRDENGDWIRCYRDFAYDEYSGDGVLFIERYKCKDNSVSELGSDFEAYIQGNPEILMQYAYEKFPFETLPVESLDGNVIIEGTGVSSFDVYCDMQHSKTVRREWMLGLYHQPKLVSKLSIDRGNGASFDRHIRLGEIHSMEDLETYQNGSYYRLSEN